MGDDRWLRLLDLGATRLRFRNPRHSGRMNSSP